MKKIALLLLLAASFSMPAFAADGAESIKLISYNLRNSHGKDGDNVWMKRRHATPEMIRREAPDVFGVQEGLIDQLHYIDAECPQYARVGVGRDDGAEKGEFMAVYYLRDRFELLDSGTFWLSETPDKVSRGWDGACNRTVTWVELKDRKSGKEFFYFNTHLDHKGKAAREEGVKLLIEKIHEIAGKKAPAIVGGDFNTPVDSPIFKPLTFKWSPARAKAATTDHKGTFSRFGSAPTPSSSATSTTAASSKCQLFATLDGNYGRLHFGPLPIHRDGLHTLKHEKSRSANSGFFHRHTPATPYPFRLRRTTTDTAATISRMPAAPFAVKGSAKTQTPITTAVSGSMAPKIEVSVGPMLLTACTSAMFETAVAGDGHTEDIEPRMRVGLKTHAARQQAPGDEKQRTEGHHAAGQHRGVDLHRAAPAHAHDVTAVGDDRDGRRNDPQRRVAVREIDVAQRQQHRADDRHADRREGPRRTAFAEETHHHDGHDQRIHEVNRRGHPAGDVLIGDHQAQRRRSAEQAQQEHRAQFAPPEAEIAPPPAGRRLPDTTTPPPAVGRDLERRITHAQQQQGEQRGQSECRRGESRPENAFDTQHKKLVWSRKNKKYIAIPHSPG